MLLLALRRRSHPCRTVHPLSILVKQRTGLLVLSQQEAMARVQQGIEAVIQTLVGWDKGHTTQ